MTHPYGRADHATHDLHLVAAATDRDADERTRLDAERQAAECGDCAALLGDLRSLDAALAALPRTLPVTRDFRITHEQAARLGRARGWRRLLRPFSPAGSSSLRPLGNAFAALGIAGLLFTVVLPGAVSLGPSSGGLAAPAAAPNDQRLNESTKGSPAPSQAPAFVTDGAGGAVRGSGGSESAPTVVAGGPAAAGATPPADSFAYVPGTQGPIGRNSGEPSGTALPSVSPVTFVAILSAVLLLLGAALFVLRRVAAREL